MFVLYEQTRNKNKCVNKYSDLFLLTYFFNKKETEFSLKDFLCIIKEDGPDNSVFPKICSWN